MNLVLEFLVLMACILVLLGSLGVLWIVFKLYTEIVKYRVLDTKPSRGSSQ